MTSTHNLNITTDEDSADLQNENACLSVNRHAVAVSVALDATSNSLPAEATTVEEARWLLTQALSELPFAISVDIGIDADVVEQNTIDAEEGVMVP